ncbi:MAG: glycosyltransferase [Salibacteraceae bacterium]
MARTRVVCFGPGPKFKGGISNYNTSLAKALDRFDEVDVHIVSWTQQYPAIIPREFVDKSSKSDLLEGTNIEVEYVTNYNNPFSWRETVKVIKDLRPQLVIFQWAIAIQGLPMGYIANQLRKQTMAEVIFDLHFVVQKENSNIDRLFTRYGIRKAKTYVVHAHKTADELKALFPKRRFEVSEDGTRSVRGRKSVIKLFHPVYDLFSPDPEFDVAAFKQEHGLGQHVFLFFGFIRKYKGLHHVIPAFKKLADTRDDVSLLVCGESFWNTLKSNSFSTRLKKAVFGVAKKIFLSSKDNEQDYNPLQLVEDLGLQDRVMLVNEFVPNEDVHKYFQVSDCGVLFYEYATPSGVESLNYNFKLPIVATRVGHFPETIREGFNGYLAEPEDINSMAEKMSLFLEKPIPRDNVAEAAKDFSWENYALAILAERSVSETSESKAG